MFAEIVYITWMVYLRFVKNSIRLLTLVKTPE